ncbi:MAG: DUF421 domain-containing protein [Clostridia bacterium]|nr:DUF421 domain-containing protein [Clostridia bacterium]
MLVPFVRTLILYLSVVTAVRLMGKRQVGEMQPDELVVTILISAVISVPMQDIDIPLFHGIVPVLTLIAAEVLISTLSLRWPRLRRLLSGRPVPVVRKGVVDQKALRELRFSVDDLLEELRLAGIFDLREVCFAQVETNGQLSVLPESDCAPATPRQHGLTVEPAATPALIIADGEVREDALRQAGMDRAGLSALLRSKGLNSPAQVFLLCADQSGGVILLRKEG